MKIIKGSFFRPGSSAFGNFDLVPEEGWQHSQSFIDYESKLLIVSVSVIDQQKWNNNGYGSWTIPTRQYIIDLSTLKILEPEEWKKRFDYSRKEIISKDGKYKLISQRIHEPERNSDFIEEELYDLHTNTKISSGSSVAFRGEKRENALEERYRSIREAEERKNKLEAKPTLEQYHREQIKKIGSVNPILCYFNDTHTYQLNYSNQKFLLEEAGKIPKNYSDWHLLNFKQEREFKTLDEFWDSLVEDPDWYRKYKNHETQSKLSAVLANYIIPHFNQLRKEHRFTQEEYLLIQDWERGFWSDVFKPTEAKQWCPHCGKEVRYNPRYPKHICRDCASKEKFALSGERLEFYNLGISGGLKIVYLDTEGKKIKEDDTQTECDCLIEGKLFFAEEARFGGIVIQKKDQ